MQQSDRREFQRLKLSKPILGTMNGTPVLVLDIGIAGAFVEHHGTVDAGQSLRLSFRWKNKPIEHQCEVARSEVIRKPGGDAMSAVSHTGLHFIGPVGDSQAALQDLIATLVGRILAAQKANAQGRRGESAGESVLARLGEARRLRSRGFVSYRLKGKTWWRVPASSPEQPVDGFTVAAWEDETEVATLCRTYEAADEEGRRLIRLVSELSAAAVGKG